jgi:site-specific DNA-methyltransferase (adenine-specific)
MTVPHRATVVHGEALQVLLELPNECADLVYIDPPFNTGKQQVMTRMADYGTRILSRHSYMDMYGTTDEYVLWLMQRIDEGRRILKPHGTMYVHLDWHEVHYVKVAMDKLFGRQNFINEIIWAYDYGGRSKDRWPRKHDTILMYGKTEKYRWNYDAIDRIPYMAPGLQRDKERAERGKTPTDVWWHTIVPTSGSERVGYPNQKPLGIVRRILLASSSPGDLVVDFFAGSGTTGVAALELGRRAFLIDENEQAIDVMKWRFGGMPNVSPHSVRWERYV